MTLVRVPSRAADVSVKPPDDLPAPATLEAAGLSLELVTQLALKSLHAGGELTGADLARRLGVLYGVIEPSLEFLTAQHHIEVFAGSMLRGSSYRYRITTQGRSYATLLLQENRYVGFAPVPLEQYRAYMETRGETTSTVVTRDSVRRAFANLVLSDVVLDEIAPAVNSGHSAFIYGPPGNGKTSIARAIGGLFEGSIAVPHAIEVEGSIIRVFDLVNHRPLPVVPETGLAPTLPDRRWMLCRRPVVVTGGELTNEALELGFDPQLGYYRAPLQVVANGGVLILDDFGRQRTAPHDLLNRWMVPLESGIDYLTLRSGVKFEMPFQAFVVFATNIKPSDLVDEAFLRRVQHKVFAENPTPESFARIFEKCCRDRGLSFDPGLVEHLLDRVYALRGITPRACHPRDLINQALLLSEYWGKPAVLTTELLDRAVMGYFLNERG
jgi:predicted ATPase with chaperone activity